MKKIITLTLTLVCIMTSLAGCSRRQEAIGGSNETVAVIPIEANKVKIVHKAEKDTTDFEVTITDRTEIRSILEIYDSMKIRRTGKPLNAERFIITLYHDDAEIAVWWLDSELTTACSAFEAGNHVIENKDFNYSYLKKLLKK